MCVCYLYRHGARLYCSYLLTYKAQPESIFLWWYMMKFENQHLQIISKPHIQSINGFEGFYNFLVKRLLQRHCVWGGGRSNNSVYCTFKLEVRLRFHLCNYACNVTHWHVSIVSPGKSQDSISIRPRPLPSKSLPIHHVSLRILQYYAI
jgi:hypothetical protein